MRSNFHIGIIVVLLAAFAAPASWGAGPGVEKLENDAVLLEIDQAHGTFLRYRDKVSGIELAPPRELAENFRLLIPTATEPRNLLLGRKQRLSGMKLDGQTLKLDWKRPLVDEHGAAHNIDVSMRVSLKSAGIEVSCSVQNDSDVSVEEVNYPVIGGFLGMDGKGAGAKVTLMPAPHDAKSFVRPFGDYAVGYPANNMSYVDLAATAHRRGLYFGVHDTLARYKLFRFREAGSKPDSEVFAELCHLPLTKPGQRFEGAPVWLMFHDGDWVAAGKQFYRPWFIDTFGLKTKDNDWIRREGFFQMIMIMLPEGNINYRIDEIPQLARDGLKYGVTSLQIAGWQRGGHDNGYPYYEPDPRLGTWEDLERAIAECHKMGVRVYFFANITVVNLDTEWYKTELKDCGWSSANGADYWVAGWGMGTLAARMGHTTPLMGFYDTSFPAMHNGHLKYFKKLAEVGADGLHLDKTFPGSMNFNPRDSMPPDTALNEGAVRLSKDILEQCNAIHPGFAISFECNLDRFLSYGAATWWAGNMTKAKEVFPELVETVGLYQPYDYFTLNEAVRNGFVIMISPYQFNRSMAEPVWQGLSEYIAEVKKIRDELADIVFYGEHIPADKGILLEQLLPAGVVAQNYRSIPGARRGCIMTNSGSQPAQLRLKEFAGDAGKKCVLYVPGSPPQPLTLPAPIMIAPERLVMIAQPGDAK
ncbi:MAG: hypothetical protein HZB26_08225 [Candidatus Hydrogenedentes bacterium]|nr:hypothetical protein [Candidatus Hydrogenedentota bacterium]